MTRRTALVLLLLLFTASALASEAPGPRYKIQLVHDGVYRVAYETLRDAGGLPERVPAERLALTHRGAPVPIWVEDGGDGSFGPGDAIEFVGRRLAGEHGYHHEFGDLNAYWLNLSGRQAARIRPAGLAADCAEAEARQLRSLRLERERLRVRFRADAADEQEVWFWTRLTPLDAESTRIALSLDDLDLDRRAPLELRLHFRGWSHLPADAARTAADHRLELKLNDHLLGNADWDNSEDGFTVAVGVLPDALRVGQNLLELRVPSRQVGGDSRAQADVVLLNWIELHYARRPTFPDRPLRIDPIEGDCLSFRGTSDLPLVLHDDDGSRVRLAGDSPRATGWRPQGAVHVVPHGEFRLPVAVTLDRSEDWRAADRRADYLIVSHARLRAAVEPLAEFHRARGLSVEVVDVAELYDDFNHGIVHPQAIRDFLEHAHRTWRHPAPRFVLLVGDASWDPRNSEAADANYVDWTFHPSHGVALAKNASTPYPQLPDRNHRNLIPTWSYGTHEGLAASDNGYVEFGEDSKPAMAIGRFPVTEPEEVAAIVAKTIRYARVPAEGEWQRRILWITNEQAAFQRRSDELAEFAMGFSAQKIYPSSSETSNAQHTERLREALDEGQLLVHFYGHGGRYIWRTGPPDLRKNHDLFTLDDLDRLQPHDRLPVVLSMTCYSAPFDHPNADSIGEKLLRLPDRGAVAVVAASWRNSPSYESSRSLIEEFTHPGTVGEAFLQAKQRSGNDEFVRQYNLLGDPAAPLALPSGP